MSFGKAFSRMDAAIFKRGEKAIYNGTMAVRIILDLDVEQFGAFDTQGSVRRHEASFLVAEVPNPKRGQSLVTDSGTFKIDGVISNDGSIVRVHINES